MEISNLIRILNQELVSKKINTSFEILLNQELVFSFASDSQTPLFSLHLSNKALSAIISLNETRIAEAYIDGYFEIEGDIEEAFKLREILVSKNILFYLWNVFIHPAFLGQIKSDKKWISAHYDHGDELYFSFMDKTRTYSQGIFEDENEELETAMLRKHQFAYEACGLKPGQRVLDIGGGWGSFCEYAGEKGVEVTSITISKDSLRYINNLIDQKGLPCKVVNAHFLEYISEKKFDAIINMGVTEHLPNYGKTLVKYVELLKPGGKVYLDASASDHKYNFSSYINKYIYPGNPSPLCLHDYLTHLANSPLELQELYNDGHNYYLTSKKWCERLEENRQQTMTQFPELFRVFKLYLYGTAHAFKCRSMTAYRLVLNLPKEVQ